MIYPSFTPDKAYYTIYDDLIPDMRFLFIPLTEKWNRYCPFSAAWLKYHKKETDTNNVGFKWI